MKLEDIENRIKGIEYEYPILSIDDTEWLINRVKTLTEALEKLGPTWLYWPSKKQFDGQPIAYESRQIQEIENMAHKALEKK